MTITFVNASGSVLDLQTGVMLSSTPSRQVEREESRAWVRLALELLVSQCTDHRSLAMSPLAWLVTGVTLCM